MIAIVVVKSDRAEGTALLHLVVEGCVRGRLSTIIKGIIRSNRFEPVAHRLERRHPDATREKDMARCSFVEREVITRDAALDEVRYVHSFMQFSRAASARPVLQNRD